jgi:hypothetical protein
MLCPAHPCLTESGDKSSLFYVSSKEVIGFFLISRKTVVALGKMVSVYHHPYLTTWINNVLASGYYGEKNKKIRREKWTNFSVSYRHNVKE